MGRNIYLSDKEISQLIYTSTEWIDMMEDKSFQCEDEEYINDIKESLNNGLGSALRKLYKGKVGEKLYKDYK